MGLADRLRLARLFLITDPRTEAGDLVKFVDAAFAGGVDMLRLRADGLDGKDLRGVLEKVRDVAFRYQGLVVVDEELDVAKEFGADLMHLGQAGGESAEARKYLHEWALIGRSAHSQAQVDAAIADPDINYFTVGPVYATTPNPEYPAPGLDLVRYTAQVAPPSDPKSKPWFAVGNVTADVLDDVLAAGARRVAVVGAITRASDPQAAARSLKDRLKDAWDADPGMERLVFSSFSGGSGFIAGR